MSIAKVIALIKMFAPGVDPAVIESAVSDWLDDHPEATTTVEDGSITFEKLNASLRVVAIQQILNGWDTVNWETGYIKANGNVQSNANFRNTDFIPVSQGDVIDYNLSGYNSDVYIVTGYDSNKAKVTGADVVGQTGFKSGSYTVPSGVAFVRLCSGNPTNANCRFNSETVYGTRLKATKAYIDEKDGALSDRISANEAALAGMDGIESIKDYYAVSPNLCDLSKTEPAPTIGTGYVWSDYMPVTEGERYTVWADGVIYKVYWYDNSKTALSNDTLSAKGAERTAPVDSAFARLVFKSADVTKLMFAHGVIGGYLEYGVLIPVTSLPSYIVRDTNNLNNTNKYVQFTSVESDTGGITNYESAWSTDFIPVEEGKTYNVGGEGSTSINVTGAASYDSSYEYVGSVTFPYTVPSGVAYIRVGYNSGVLCVREGNNGVTGFSTFDKYDTFRLVNAKPTAYEQANGLYGITWAAMGDSITEGAGTTKTYRWYIAERTGVIPINYGASNTAIARRGEAYTNDMCMRYSSMSDDADIVTVFGGTNDHGNNIPIGEWGDSTVDTLYGAMKILCEGLIGKYMGKKIGFILPLPKYATNSNVDYSYPNESFGAYIECIKDVCKRYSIPYLDLYTECGFAPKIEAVRTAMIPDGLHPNAVGHELISWQIQRFLERL